jgi:Protein of unknown function (DUF3014)
MNKTEIAVAVLLVVMVAAVMYVQRPVTEPEILPLQEEPPVANAPPVEEEPAVRYPVEQEPAQSPTGVPTAPGPDFTTPADSGADQAAAAPAAEALPPLDESDSALQHELEAVFSAPSLARLFHTDRLIRRLVVSVDNLPGRQYPRSNYRIARAVPGQLVVRRVRLYPGQDETLYLNPDNYARYTPYIKFFTGMDSGQLVAIYRHYYPLFQAAYEDLGYPSAYFNDRLVEVIDNLLATPAVTGPVKLVRPHVLYQYADPDLEALSAGQKILIRVGPENAEELRSKLKELRRLLTSTPENEQGDTPDKVSSSRYKIANV